MARSNPWVAEPRRPAPSTLAPPPFSVAKAVAQLKTTWHTLPDFERAQAVLPIVRAGMSRRHLAAALNVSEGAIRNLLLILKAEPGDLDSFRRGEISQNELIRRVRGTSTQRSVPEKNSELESAEAEPEFTTDPIEVCRLVLNWLAKDKQRADDAYLALTFARIRIREAVKRGRLPRRYLQMGVPVEEIIRSCRPNQRHLLSCSWYAEWLLSWVFQLLPNPKLCRDALDMAWSRVRFRIDRPELW